MERLKVLFVATFFGLAAGLSGAAMLVGWVWPVLGGGDIFITSRASNADQRQLVQGRVSALVQDTLFTVYNKTAAVSDKNIVSLGTPVGTGVGVLSQGWVVTALPPATRAQDLLLVGINGRSYSVTDIAVDKITGASYMRIARLLDGATTTIDQQIHTVPLASNIPAQSDIEAVNGNTWYFSSLTQTAASAPVEAHTLGATVYSYQPLSSLPSGAAVFDVNGRLVGFVIKNNVVALATDAAALAELTATKSFARVGLGVLGWFSEERPLILHGERVSGFFVSKVDTKTTILKKGDILLTVNGQPFTMNEWQKVGEPSTVRLTVYRNGANLELTAPTLKE